MKKLSGQVESITFQSAETGYTVAKLKVTGHRILVPVVGNMPALQAGEVIECHGQWKTHPKHGRQFEIQQSKTVLPVDAVGIEKYLGSGLIKGIGPVFAARIVEIFGVNTLEVIDENPLRLLDVPGIGRGRMATIRACWEGQRVIRNVMVFLQQYGVSCLYAAKIFKVYGHNAIDKVTKDPYQLARDIRGIGFMSADAVASKMGHSPDAAQRIAAGIEYTLAVLSDQGHVCYPVDDLVAETQLLLKIPEELIKERLEALAEEQRIFLGDLKERGKTFQAAWKAPLKVAEVGIATEVHRLMNAPCRLRTVNAKKATEWVQKQLSITLANNQSAAVQQALSSKAQIITGGPGTGKSTITNAILRITQQLSPNILLAAPTGRAAKRMTEITGRKASTIHALLEYDIQTHGFKRNSNKPLTCDLLIVDEASMIDTTLMFYLLRAIPHHARVIFVGDIHQLPSVGPGNVLRDLIASKALPVTQLTDIFRQAAGSAIVTNAHRINRGQMPELNQKKRSDFFFIARDGPDELVSTLIHLVKTRLPDRYGFDALSSLQVLSPMKRGTLGTENLNAVLQEQLNPSSQPLIRMGRRFAPGDKVMQTRNDYQREVYNGDVGQIQKIDQVEQQVIVVMDGRPVAYDFIDLDQLSLAYAVSIHKYQGSECRCVVIIMHTSHFKLLHRNLLYTGVTRGKELVIVIGSRRAVSIAVSHDDVRRRHTGLKQLLMLEEVQIAK